MAMQKLSAAGQLTKSWHVIAEPEARTNSFVGTEEYLAPEVITGVGHGAFGWIVQAFRGGSSAVCVCVVAD